MAEFELNRELIARLLSTVDAGLCAGVGHPAPGHMCVEAAVCYAMGLRHSDNPPCVDPVIRAMKIRLNDAPWSSKAARAEGMRRLAVLQLGTKDSGFNRREFAEKLALMTIKFVLPIALTAKGLQDHAAKCQAVATLAEGRIAAAYAADAADAADAAYAAYAARCGRRAAAYAADAADAADAAYAAYAVYAADHSAFAAYAAAAGAVDAAKRGEVLSVFAKGAEDILIEMNVPAVKYLDMLK